MTGYLVLGVLGLLLAVLTVLLLAARKAEVRAQPGRSVPAPAPEAPGDHDEIAF